MTVPAPSGEERSWLPASMLLRNAIVLIAAAALYLMSLFNGFAFDDSELVVNNTTVHGFSVANIVSAFTGTSSSNEYLPLRDLAYMLDYQVWQLNPFGYHLSNLALYLCCCLALYLLLARLAGRWHSHGAEIAFIATLLFVFHPLHVEVVAGVAQRKDLLACLFVIFAVACHLRFLDHRRPGPYALALICTLLALFSKSSAVMVPLLLFAVERMYPRDARPLSASLLAVVPHLLATVVVAGVQMKITAAAGYVGGDSAGASLMVRLLNTPAVLWENVRLLLIPYPLSVTHILLFSPSPWTVRILAGSLLALGLAATFVLTLKRQKIVAFSIAWLLIALVPVSGIIPTGLPVAERYLFIPSVAVCLFLGYLAVVLDTSRGRRIGIALCLALILSAYAAVALPRIRDWRDSVSLYAAEIRANPNQVRLYWIQGGNLFWSGRYAEAFRYLDEARRRNPNYDIDYRVFSAFKAFQDREYDRVLQTLDSIRFPGKNDIYEVNYLRGKALLALGDREQARKQLTAAVSSRYFLRIIVRNEAALALQRLSGGAP